VECRTGQIAWCLHDGFSGKNYWGRVKNRRFFAWPLFLLSGNGKVAGCAPLAGVLLPDPSDNADVE
jgi:hypothetical protein